MSLQQPNTESRTDFTALLTQGNGPRAGSVKEREPGQGLGRRTSLTRVGDQTRAQRFVGTDLAGALFRDVDLTGATITGLIDGLKVNDVEVAPLIAAELERRHPELILFRSDVPADLARGWQIVRDQWQTTVDRIRCLCGRSRNSPGSRLRSPHERRTSRSPSP